MEFNFEIAQQKDLPEIVTIYNQSIPTRIATADTELVSVAEKQEWFDSYNEDFPIWVIKDKNKIAGWVALEPFYGRPAYQKTAEISIYISQSYQKKGLGQKSLDFVFSKLDELKINVIVANIFSHNLPSQKLFQNNNFEQWGHLPDVAIMDSNLYSLDILGRHFD
ncbi:GNAT family N-acetyltransferase [Lactobacillus sp. S2-2]|uniref:GNAT family N-acetyltransferase n=1 Tax=Lactobacillus sp. S2-2 TaxID=2692917 RepID=UPI001F3D6C05|nr:GNAT family N-acetyltransferase [Lactobacillus sp. S2-2]MCF6515594.1 GNAT family N-acetyltransferase [Lactobacillus sp. S2-2]